MTRPIAEVAALLEASGVPYAIIGAHAVNVWLEPRFTADIDVTVQAGSLEMTRLKTTLFSHGFTITREHGAELPSGPDFVRSRPTRRAAKPICRLQSGRRCGASLRRS
jgi:hypothetical protein